MKFLCEASVVSKLRLIWERKSDQETPEYLLIIVSKPFSSSHATFGYWMSSEFRRVKGVFDRCDSSNDRHESTEIVPRDKDGAYQGDSEGSNWEDGDELSVDDVSVSGGEYPGSIVSKAILKICAGRSSDYHFAELQASSGWKAAILQDLENLRVKANIINQHATSHQATRAGAAVAGGGVATGATTMGAAAMGYTSTGIAANSFAASIMSMEAVAGGGGIAAGGFTATMQSVGTVGLMANPILGASIAAVGAAAGLYTMHRCSKSFSTTESAQQFAKEYRELLNKKQKSDGKASSVDGNHEIYVVISVKSFEVSSNNCPRFVPTLCPDELHASTIFQELSSKGALVTALFDSKGCCKQVDAPDGEQHGWTTALKLYHEYLFLF